MPGKEHTAVNDAVSTPIAPAQPRRFGRQAELLLGLVFLVSAVLKAADVNNFIVQIANYGVMVLAFQTLTALAVLLVETGLGMLLLFGLWRRFTLAMTMLLLLGFTQVVLYGWIYLHLDDCGCMGVLKMPPVVSVIKNIVLIALVIEAWRGLVSKPRAERPPMTRGRLLKRAGLVLLSFIMAFVVSGYAAAHVKPVQETLMGPRPFSAFEFKANGKIWDLGKGEYFVALLSMTCPHCKKIVPTLNELSTRSDFPTVVGLCKRNDKKLEEFMDQTKPAFPIHMVEVRDFWRLIGFSYPRFVLVRDGSPVKIWDGSLPSVETIQKARSLPITPKPKPEIG
jgi:uncharacterized membrane protein YphA (DoxX/SURF4 family)/thiol-disulfide isomerase/thioredoxin